jgi:hypothetical protein
MVTYILVFYRIGPGTCLYLLKEMWCNCLTADGIVPALNNSTAVTGMSKVTKHSKNKILRATIHISGLFSIHLLLKCI